MASKIITIDSGNREWGVGSGATRDGEQSLDRRSRGARSPSRKAHRGSRESGIWHQKLSLFQGTGSGESGAVRPVMASNPLTVGHAGRVRHHGKRTEGVGNMASKMITIDL
ncbi:hypothetical protein [Moorena sp. SIOASIH]|uniref:hypothetical protein n=1 Tax=Moorena sp. SIOASIH TaxID=2607817 RepID=UPI0025E14740|nr:hypothetical protein [Moorena sp. SIOASIH]